MALQCRATLHGRQRTHVQHGGERRLQTYVMMTSGAFLFCSVMKTVKTKMYTVADKIFDFFQGSVRPVLI